MQMDKKISLVKKISNKLKIPKKDNLGIPRRNMPQIKNKHMDSLQNWLENEEISYKEVLIPAKKLKPTQKDFNTKKVEILLKNDENKKLEKALLVSKDFYILDGHHKWLANLNLDENKKIKCIQVDLDIVNFLKKIKEFPKTRYKDLKDNTFKTTDPKLKYASKRKKLIAKILAKLNLINLKDENRIRELVNSNSYDILIDLARNKNIPKDVAVVLSKNKEEDVKIELLNNPSINRAILVNMLKDKSIKVRELLTTHPKITEKDLLILKEDSAASVKSKATKELENYKKVAKL
jgi:hypothetical protein